MTYIKHPVIFIFINLCKVKFSKFLHDQYMNNYLYLNQLYFLLDQIPFSILEKSNKMQKIPERTTKKKLFPSIYGNGQEGKGRSYSEKHQKENLFFQRNQCDRSTNRGNKQSFGKKFSHQNISSKEDVAFAAFNADRTVSIQQTKKKSNRVWLDQLCQQNRQTIKGQQFKSIYLQNKLEGEKIKNIKKPIFSTFDDDPLPSLAKTKELIPNKIGTIRFSHENSNNKEKAKYCRIAMKKGIFPINQKHYEQLRVNQYFDKQDAISAISKRQESQEDRQFITMQSFMNIVF